MTKRGELKGDEYTRIRIENERLEELAQLTDGQRTTLRKAIIKGSHNRDASVAADCSVHAAITMRARLDGLGLVDAGSAVGFDSGPSIARAAKRVARGRARADEIRHPVAPQ